MFHVPEKFRIATGRLASVPAAGNNGMFAFYRRGKQFKRIEFHVMASDGDGWEHASVNLRDRPPTWEEMCYVKSLFWDPEDCVVQYHPAESGYVNVAPHCLHLWRPIGVIMPAPPTIMV